MRKPRKSWPAEKPSNTEQDFCPAIISAAARILFVVGILAKDKSINLIHALWHSGKSSPRY
ncbi:MAG: hypothetical protein NTV82_16055 [Candidatus Aminicenantes bacterium]|nr:hypothetical protein [Candidatus Aminicenantes bacterium]